MRRWEIVASAEIYRNPRNASSFLEFGAARQSMFEITKRNSNRATTRQRRCQTLFADHTRATRRTSMALGEQLGREKQFRRQVEQNPKVNQTTSCRIDRLDRILFHILSVIDFFIKGYSC